MARRVKIITITADGRDKGKQFRLTEMAALDAERWAAQALLAVCRYNPEVSLDGMHNGMAALVNIGLAALMSLSFAEAEPLMARMLDCIEYVTDTKTGYARALVGADDIEEVRTVLELRHAVLDLHLGFSVADAVWSLAAASARDKNPSNSPIS